MASSLMERGHQVAVVCLSDDPSPPGEAYPFALTRLPRKAFKPWRYFRTFLTLYRAARAADVVYVNGLSAEAGLAARLARRPQVHKVVGDYAWERACNRGWFTGTLDEYQRKARGGRFAALNWLRNFPLWNADAVVVPSRYLSRIASGWRIRPDRIRVVYNAVEPVPEGYKSAPALPPHAGPTLITICRLVPWKGVSGLLRLAASQPALRLVIVGDGPLRSALEAEAARLGVSARAIFTGHLARAQAMELLRGADAFVLNSNYEGLPHVVLEAMEARVPVIAADAGGTGELVIDGETGLLVPVGNEAALEDAVKRLLENPTARARMVENAQRQLAGRFGLENMIAATESVLAGMCPAREGVSERRIGMEVGG
jgi:glycosyltransferase involved in cell wall biosynthesis